LLLGIRLPLDTIARVISQTTHASLLVRLADRQDAAAWEEFTARYAELVRSFARRRGLQASDGDDVLQEVMLAVSRNMPGFEYDPGRGRFRGYLKTIAVRAILKKQRQRRGLGGNELPEHLVESASRDADLDQQWEEEWRRYHLRQAMRVVQATSSDDELAVFELYVGQGRSAEEVAGELGMSVDSVYQSKSRMLKRLRAQVATQVAEEG